MPCCDRRTGSRAVLFLLTHQQKCCVSHHLLSSSLVLCSDLGLSHRPHLVNSAKNKFVSAHAEQYEFLFELSAHSERCEVLERLLRALGEVRALENSGRVNPPCPIFRALCEVRILVSDPRELRNSESCL